MVAPKSTENGKSGEECLQNDYFCGMYDNGEMPPSPIVKL